MKLTILEETLQQHLAHHCVLQPPPLSSFKTFLSLQSKTLYPFISFFPQYSLTFTLASTNLCSVSTGLPVLTISY